MERYLLVIDKIEGFGAEKILLDYKVYLEKKGCEVFVFSLYCKNSNTAMPGVKYGVIGENPSNPFKKIIAQRELGRLLQKFVDEIQPTRIFSFLERSNLLACSLKTKAQIVASVHNVLSIQYKKIKNPIIRAILKREISLAYSKMSLVAVSMQVKIDLMAEFGVPSKNIIVINNKVDRSELLKKAAEPVTEYSFDDKYKYIINVGRFTLQKAQWKLLKAMLHLNTTCANHNIKLLLLGSGEYEEEIREFITKHNLSEIITIIPYHSNPYKFFANSTCVVMPSLFEGFPITIAESAALSLPFIGSDKAIPSEMFSDDALYERITYANSSCNANFTSEIELDDKVLSELIVSTLSNSSRLSEIVSGYTEWNNTNEKIVQFNEFCDLFK